MNRRRYNGFNLIILSILLCISGCKVNYSFSGASISTEVKTVSVQFFPNRARIVNPTLSQEFTNALMDKIKGQTNLIFMENEGDVNFSGEITDYKTNILAITGDERSAMTRFTVAIRIKYANILDGGNDYDRVFSRYKDYDSTLDLSDVEEDLVAAIIDDITEDAFNAAFVNW